MKLWKAYYWFYALLLLFSIVSSVSSGDVGTATGLFLFGVISLWALHGLIQKKAYLHLLVWKVLFVFQVLAILSMAIAFLIPAVSLGFGYMIAVLPYVLINILVIGPAVYGTYWYAFKYQSIWQ